MPCRYTPRQCASHDSAPPPTRLLHWRSQYRQRRSTTMRAQSSCTPPATSGSRSATTRRSSSRPTRSSASSATCICGSDLWPYRGIETRRRPDADGPRVRRRRRGGRRATSRTIKPGQFVVGSFFASDNTCEICRAGYQTALRAPRAHGRDRHPGRVRADPAGRRHPRRHPRHAGRGPDPEPAGRLRRAGHRLVRRRRRRGRARARPSPSSATARSGCSVCWPPSSSARSGSSR